jgi:hypothetical protein
MLSIQDFAGRVREGRMSEQSPQPGQQIAIERSFKRLTICDAAVPADLAEMICRWPEVMIERGERLQWKVRRTVLLTWRKEKFVFKQYREPSRRHAFKQLFQHSRAWQTWSFAHRLANAGIATPRPVACIENRWGRLRRDSFLMYPYVEGRTLRSYFDEEAVESPVVREGLWKQIHNLWQQLATLRVSLGDTNVSNFIVGPTGQLWLIDLDKSRFHLARISAAPHQQRAWLQLLRSAAKC